MISQVTKEDLERNAESDFQRWSGFEFSAWIRIAEHYRRECEHLSKRINELVSLLQQFDLKEDAAKLFAEQERNVDFYRQLIEEMIDAIALQDQIRKRFTEFKSKNRETEVW